MNKKQFKKRSKVIIIIILLIFIISILQCIFYNIVNKDYPDAEFKQNNDKDSKTNINEKISIIDLESKNRPYAVMINCHNAALPQSGLNKAYIVYELMVEGGITRMMALFKDVDVEKIGSIRSARTQFLMYMYENDAIYVHAGGAPDALEQIKNESIEDIDVDSQYGKRDTNLNRAWEHTLFTSSDLLSAATSNKKIRTTTAESNLLTYSLSSVDLKKYTQSKQVNSVEIKYSDYRTTIYKYDEKNKMYLRSMNQEKNVDLVTGEQYVVKNIIAYAISYSSYTYSGYSGYQKINNLGSGEGIYITEGYSIPIIWEKESKNSKTKYIIKETHEELVVNDGNTYIQIYPTTGSIKLY